MNRKNEEKRVLQACNAISHFFYARISALTTEGHLILLFRIYIYIYIYVYIIVYLTAVHFVCLLLFPSLKHHRKRNQKDLLVEMQTFSQEKVNEWNDNHCTTSLFSQDMSKETLGEIQFIKIISRYVLFFSTAGISI
jgi:hypothetical protein